MTRPLDIVIIGLSLSSSWGNGHATTYRALLRGLHAQGHSVLFLERDVPWYAAHRDLADPEFCELAYYSGIEDMLSRYRRRLCSADAVIIGSYVPEGIALIEEVAQLRPKRLCFYDIDTPVTVAGLNRGETDYLAITQLPLFDAYFSFSGGPLIDQLRTRYGTPNPLPLYCSVDESRYRNTGEAAEWDLGYLGTYSPDRQPTLEKLLIEPARRLPHMRFVVAGPSYPGTIGWPENVERIDHLGPADHASFYSRQRFTLNVTRADMIAAGWSPSVRLFEAAACATPIISDRWDGLGELLPENDAVFIADGTQDVTRLLTECGGNRRIRAGQAARSAVLASHTGQARARELASALSAITPRGKWDALIEQRLPA